MTTRGGFSSFARFKAWAGNAKPNHQWHHIVEQGDVRSILRTPQDPYTQMLLESMLVGKTPLTPLLAGSSIGGTK